VFLRLPFHFGPHIQQTALLLNTVVLILALIVTELVYSEEKREHLKYFYPLFIVLVGLLIYAGYKQTKGA
jgi:hypothetical protein